MKASFGQKMNLRHWPPNLHIMQANGRIHVKKDNTIIKDPLNLEVDTRFLRFLSSTL